MELLISAFLLGLASTFHCVAMCGPIAMALPIGKLNSTQKLVAIISYHLTRIIVYGLLGLLIGLLGEFLRLIEFLQVLSLCLKNNFKRSSFSKDVSFFYKNPNFKCERRSCL